jgi:hypothetical protein
VRNDQRSITLPLRMDCAALAPARPSSAPRSNLSVWFWTGRLLGARRLDGLSQKCRRSPVSASAMRSISSIRRVAAR